MRACGILECWGKGTYCTGSPFFTLYCAFSCDQLVAGTTDCCCCVQKNARETLYERCWHTYRCRGSALLPAISAVSYGNDPSWLPRTNPQHHQQSVMAMIHHGCREPTQRISSQPWQWSIMVAENPIQSIISSQLWQWSIMVAENQWKGQKITCYLVHGIQTYRHAINTSEVYVDYY